MVKALIAITSYNEKFYENGSRTGVFVVEALHPYDVFTKGGVEVDFVSETGTFGWDESSLGPDFLNGRDKETFEDINSGFITKISAVKKPSEVKAEDYKIFFASAGHGAAYDYPQAIALQKLVAQIYANSGVVSAVCHGPAIFDNLKTLGGRSFIEGKKITGFTDEGEEILNVAKIMEQKHMKTMKRVAEDNGATYVQPPDPWGSFCVVDGKLVTGVNPASAVETAEEALGISAT